MVPVRPATRSRYDEANGAARVTTGLAGRSRYGSPGRDRFDQIVVKGLDRRQVEHIPWS